MNKPNDKILGGVDESTFGNLPEGMIMVAASIGAVAYLTSFPTPGDKEAQEPFPLNIEGAAFVEEYVKTMIKDRVAKWDKTSGIPKIKRAKLDNGEIVFGKAAQAQFQHRFVIAGMVIGQIIAQECGLKWMKDVNGGLPILGNGHGVRVYPYRKVYQFAVDRERLVVFVQAVKQTIGKFSNAA
jgi:hypothetical protein